jgi:hypothetical protein
MLLPDDHLDTDIVCVSTGTGIAPFRSFWRRLFYDAIPGRPGGYQGRFKLYSGFANRDSILYGGAALLLGFCAPLPPCPLPLPARLRPAAGSANAGTGSLARAPPRGKAASPPAFARRAPGPATLPRTQSGDELDAMAAAYPNNFHLAMALSLEGKNQKGGLEYVQARLGVEGGC